MASTSWKRTRWLRTSAYRRCSRAATGRTASCARSARDLYLETFDENDPSKVGEAKIEGAVLPTYPLTSTVLRCAMLPDDRCLVTASFEYGEASGLARAYSGGPGHVSGARMSRFSKPATLGSVPRHGGGGRAGCGLVCVSASGFGDGYVLASAFADVAACGRASRR